MAGTLVPEQKKGFQSDNEFSIHCNSREDAIRLYNQAIERLIDINHWQKYAGQMLAKFELCNKNGDPKENAVEEGDYFKIDIPGPGSVAGEGYDWVQIEKIYHDDDPAHDTALTGIRVRPVPSPCNDKNDTAHFFAEDATSSFIVKREKKTVTAEIHGRNEVPNNNTNSTVDNVRNKLVAGLAARAFSDIQWQQLIKGLLS